MSRGSVRTELREIVAPGHSMLIVWDMQNALVNRVFNKDELLGAVGALIRAARRLQLPVLYTKITPLPPRFQPPAAVLQQMRRQGVKDVKQLRPSFGDDPNAMDIAGPLAPLEGDIVVNKNTASVFRGTNVDYIARHGGIETLIFAGISTEFGIETSAREALTRGYYAVVVSDAVSSGNQEAHLRSLASMRGLCDVVAHGEILKAWEGGTA